MKRDLSLDDQDAASSSSCHCAKRANLEDTVKPKEHLWLDEINAEMAKIKTCTDAVKSWPSLAEPMAGAVSTDWLNDLLRSTAYRPPHNPKFILFVRHVLASVYRRPPTATITRLTDKYLDLAERHHLPTWDSPIELFLGTLLFCDGWQADFLELAWELHNDGGDELIALCCWAVSARQMVDHRQQDLTREAVTNLIALILTLKKGPAFKYNSFSFEFVFKGKTDDDTEVEVWVPDFARFWFGVEMPDFCKMPSRIAEFCALVSQQ